MAITSLTALQNLGLPEILLWLLVFAVVYGILKQFNIPSSKPAQAIIGIAFAFLVLMAAPIALVNVITQMTSSLILVLVGLLVLIIFLEVAGITATKEIKDAKTGAVLKTEPIKIFEKYGYAFAIILGIIAILIFINAGGLGLIGMQNINLSGASTTTVIFFIIILLAIFWLIGEKG